MLRSRDQAGQGPPIMTSRNKERPRRAPSPDEKLACKYRRHHRWHAVTPRASATSGRRGAGRCCSTAAARGWTGIQPPGGSAGSPGQRESRSPGHILMLRHTCDHARRGRRSARCPDRCPARRPPHVHAPERARKNLDRHPNYILASYMASGHLTRSQARGAVVPK